MSLFDAGFPFVWWNNQPGFDGGFPLGPGDIPAPRVLSASASEGAVVQAQTVLVEYNEEVEHTNPLGGNDALNPSNYNFSGGPFALNAVSVAVVTASPTVVRVTLDREMQLGHVLNVLVADVKSVATGKVIDPAFDDANFASGGVRPQLLSAAMSSLLVTAQLDETLLNDGVLTNPANYVFAGPSSLTASAAVRYSPLGQPVGSAVRVTTNRALIGGAYTITISNITDSAGNSIDPAHNVVGFTGYATDLRVQTPTAPHSALEVDVDFSDPVRQINPANADDALNPANYQFALDMHGGPPVFLGTIVTGVTSLTATKVRVAISLTTPLPPAADLLVIVSNVKDIPGNLVSATHNYAEFVSLGTGSPSITFYPAHGYTGMAIDQPVQIVLVDTDPASTGIDMTSLQIDVDFEGQSHHAVLAGVVQPSWVMTVTGDPLDPVAGVTLVLESDQRNWLERVAYTFGVYVEDNGSAANYEAAGITTKDAVYIEDQALPAYTDLERKLMFGMKSQRAEEVRKIAVRACTVSADAQVAARTLISMSLENGLSPLFTGQIPASLRNNDMKFRRSPTAFAEALAWLTDVRVLFQSDPITSANTVDLVHKRQLTNDRVLFSSATAAALVLVALSEIQRGIW